MATKKKASAKKTSSPKVPVYPDEIYVELTLSEDGRRWELPSGVSERKKDLDAAAVGPFSLTERRRH